MENKNEFSDLINKDIINKTKESGAKSEKEIKDVAEKYLIDFFNEENEKNFDKYFHMEPNKEGDGYFIQLKDKVRGLTMDDLNERGLIIAMISDGLLLKNVHPDRLTEVMCRYAVEQNHFALHYVPERFMTAALFEFALQSFLDRNFKDRNLLVSISEAKD